MTPTREMITAAQNAGNIAYQQAESFGATLTERSNAYYAAYHFEMALQESIAQAAPVLSAADIAEMEARCAETATEAPSYDGMWK